MRSSREKMMAAKLNSQFYDKYQQCSHTHRPQNTPTIRTPMTVAECYRTTKYNVGERREDSHIANPNANTDYKRNETLNSRPQIPKACGKEMGSPTGKSARPKHSSICQLTVQIPPLYTKLFL